MAEDFDNEYLKWLENPPEDWNEAPEEPPAGRNEHVPLEGEITESGIVIREPGSNEAYIYASGYSVSIEEMV